jgi:predicted transcriptional regulator
MAVMAKKPLKKEVLYVEIPADLKQVLAEIAELRSRKLTAEVILALREYAQREAKKEGVKWPPPPAPEKEP